MLIYDIVPPKLKDTPRKRKVLKISFWALCIGVIFSFGLAIFLFLQSTQTTTASPDPGWLTGWSYRKKITIDETKVDADLTDFPVLVKLTSANFDFTKALSTGYDIRFTSSDGTTLLKYERERHDQANSLAEYWVKVPSVSGTVNTEFYIYYGNSGAADGADPTAVWDANFKGVWHLKDITSTTIGDSTTNANDGTKYAVNEPIEVDGKIGKAQSFDGVDDYVLVSHNASLNVSYITLEAWANLVSWDDGGPIICKGTGAGGEVWCLDVYLNKFRFYFWKGGSAYILDSLTAPSGWQHIVATYDGTNTRFYVNGAETNSAAPAQGVLDTNTHEVSIGSRQSSSAGYDCNVKGLIDEVRIYNRALSPAEIVLLASPSFSPVVPVRRHIEGVITHIRGWWSK